MAKKSKIAKNKKRMATVAHYAEQRAALKKTIRSAASSEEEKEEAMDKLHSLPRNANPIRVRNRCELTGRPRGYYRKFGLGRIALREKALAGELPGITKASW